MCGIFCHIQGGPPVAIPGRLERSLRQRGPDSYSVVTEQLSETIGASFAAAVLCLRCDDDAVPVAQPFLLEEDRGLLCWNGEAWRYGSTVIIGSDTRFIGQQLSTAIHDPAATLEVLTRIRGPFAFIFLCKPQSRVYFGRDRQGRRSLLQATTSDGAIVLSSVADTDLSPLWDEVEANCIHILDYSQAEASSMEARLSIQTSSYARESPDVIARSALGHMSPQLDMTIPPASEAAISRLSVNAAAVEALLGVLRASLNLRVPPENPAMESSVAVLFSGGLDCGVLARLLHEALEDGKSIDLVNVAFENPRVHASGTGEPSAYEKCPDRITARRCLLELQANCPGRCFNFVAVDIPYSESMHHKEDIKELMHPHDTEMDLSIALALYFAARGSKRSRVLFSGLGADELFGGYQRHAVAYARHGYQALLQELSVDINRLGKRNLGRDDRVISRWAREVRYPYLDEDVVRWALGAPIWNKTGFGFRSRHGEETVMLDDKLILRCAAKKLGMVKLAEEKKRAIQFGSRSAKMQSGRTRGSEIVE